MQQFIPQIGMGFDSVAKANTGFVSPFGSGGGMPAIDAPQKSSFKDIMGNMASNLNQSVNAPDQMLQDSVAGNGVDVHDVVIAMSKAEIGVNIATQLTTKIVQSYEKIMAIQV